ncbi:MAG TPA: zf-HC2 domain-containing protein [Candidatus Cloacimonadota bacterium]|jgi:predicted anti-sigma-YlaC factor YlaD|nr:zf-HC2 domain-containing protein [Candidatus Cloacimonadales bacterium]HPY97178.1 zf-HC2 domain-containing protein [Candidatus Cloacimonadota bacterium]HQB40653.1 zf-HC2 domain-containing protein [Candidatus Cloacimonadota bacterium]
MKCETAKKKLNAYLDNELISNSKREIELHLSSCHACQQKLMELKALNNQLVFSFEERLSEDLINDLVVKSRFVKNQPSKLSHMIFTAVSMCLAIFLGAYISNASFQQHEANSYLTQEVSNEVDVDYYDYNSLYAILEEVSE